MYFVRSDIKLTRSVVFVLASNKRKKKSTRGNSGTKPNSDESISTVLEEDEELGSNLNEDEGLLSLVEDLCCDEPAAVTAPVTATENTEQIEKSSTYQNVEESLESTNAPTEIHRATALMLGVGLMDKNTARLITHDILNQSIESDGFLEAKLPGDEKSNQSPKELDRGEGTNTLEASSFADGPTAEVDTLSSVLSLCPANENNNLPPSPPALPPPSPPSTTVLRASIFTMHSPSPTKD